MPTYDYECDACNYSFEQFQPITAKPVRKCPRCGKPKVRRLIGTGAGIIFKGSGFYQTDYRSASYKQAAEKDKAPSSAAGSSSTPSTSGAAGGNGSPGGNAGGNGSSGGNAGGNGSSGANGSSGGNGSSEKPAAKSETKRAAKSKQ